MAVNNSRSMNADLQEGITDGSVKKVAPNRGGSLERSDPEMRGQQLQAQYSITDSFRNLSPTYPPML